MKKKLTKQTDCECAHCHAERMEKLLAEGEVVSIVPTAQFAEYLTSHKAAKKGNSVRPKPRSASFPVLTRESVEMALDEIDKGSRPVPKNRDSTNWCLLERGRHYPPKYVLSRAKRIQGIELHGFRGGPRTNIQLQNLGYVIREEGCGCGNTCNSSD